MEFSRNGNHIISRENILCFLDSLSMSVSLGSTVRLVIVTWRLQVPNMETISLHGV